MERVISRPKRRARQPERAFRLGRTSVQIKRYAEGIVPKITRLKNPQFAIITGNGLTYQDNPRLCIRKTGVRKSY